MHVCFLAVCVCLLASLVPLHAAGDLSHQQVEQQHAQCGPTSSWSSRRATATAPAAVLRADSSKQHGTAGLAVAAGMALLCAISGNVPEVPVVSTKSGHVFEKSLITKYVAETGKDPISGQELTQEDLLPLNTNKTIKPRSSAATSIPGLLGLFHDEWDALMLEHHTLRQNLHTVRRGWGHKAAAGGCMDCSWVGAAVMAPAVQ